LGAKFHRQLINQSGNQLPTTQPNTKQTVNMKKTILIVGLVAMGALSSFAQGTITFKTSGTKNPVYSATDGTTSTVTAVPTGGTAGSFGTISYEMLTAPTGTAGLTAADLNAIGLGGAAPAGWTETAITGVTYSGPGVIVGQTVTLPASAGAAGANALMEVFAYTGTLASPTLFGYSGETFANGQTVTAGTTTTSTGALDWSQATGNPPLTAAGTIPTGSAGMGSIVLVPTATPEPSTIALGGLGAAALLLFRRRK
jgi:hypothetical protein